MRVAVIGATGYVGGRLVPELLSAGHQVTCVVRTPERLAGVEWHDSVQVEQADVLDKASLDGALAGIDAVYYLVHAMGNEDDFEQTDRMGAENARSAAEDAGVSRIIYLGGLGEDDPDQPLSSHLASRHEVGQILAAGPVPVIELRAAVIIGSGSASFEMLRNLTDVLPAMVCPRWVTKTKCQPIAIADVLHYLVGVLDLDAVDAIYEIGGPDVLTYRDMMAVYARCAGLKQRLILPVPFLTPRLSSHWINVVTPLPYGLARPLVDSLINDVVVSPERDIRQVIDHEPYTLEVAIKRALARVGDLRIKTSWMDSAPTRSAASPMPQDPDWAGGTIYQDVQEVTTTATPERLFAVVTGIGGDRGWFVANILWTLRGVLDKLIGGVGMRRGRRHPDDLRVGDALDFFRVEAYEPPNLLRLRAEMKVPGDAWLEWRISEPESGGDTGLRQLARFHPRGIAGRAYWWVLLPIHKVMWRLLAERLAATSEAAPPG